MGWGRILFDLVSSYWISVVCLGGVMGRHFGVAEARSGVKEFWLAGFLIFLCFVFV
jgi:hypothetical protein